MLEVAVLGEFKRGKSSLIDALLGKDVLPVGVLPLRAVPTVLERGDPAVLQRRELDDRPYRLTETLPTRISSARRPW